MKLYRNIYTLKVWDYFKIIANDEIRLMSPFPLPKKKLYTAFSRILSDYKAMTINDDIKSQDEVQKRIERMKRAYLEILCALTILKYRESVESCIILRKYFVISGDETRESCVKKAVSTLKSRKIEIDEMMKGRKESKRPVMADFLREVQILRKNGFSILDTTTVAEYVQIQNIAYENLKKNGTGDNK